MHLVFNDWSKKHGSLYKASKLYTSHKPQQNTLTVLHNPQGFTCLLMLSAS